MIIKVQIVNNAQFIVHNVKDQIYHVFFVLAKIEIVLLHHASNIYNIKIFIVVWMDIMMYLYHNVFNVLTNVLDVKLRLLIV